MKYSLSVALFCGLLCLSACSPKPKVEAEDVALSTAANQFILPWHEQFVQKSNGLLEQAERFCQNSDNQGEFAATQDAWVQTMLQWQRVSLINFGPITDGNQSWRIQFWPDSHNRVGRKVEQLLSAEDPITAASLAEGVVLTQGLSALEYLLFDPSFGGMKRFEAPRACQFLVAASENVLSTATKIHNGWLASGQNYVGTFLSPGESNLAYPSDREALAALLSSTVSALEVLKNRKIGEPFGGEPGKGRINPYKLELWRSELSLTAMQTQVIALRTLFNTVYAPLLEQSGQKKTSDLVDIHLGNLQDQLDRASGPLFITLRKDSQASLWQDIWQNLSAALGLLKRDVTLALSLQLGFNDNDGD